MKAWLFPVFLCLVVGIYLIISELVHMPTLANTRAVLKLAQTKKVHGIKAIEARLSAGLAKHIRLNAYRRRTMTATLKYAEIDTTPEAYYAQAIVKAAFRFLPGILCALVFPITIAIFVLWALKGYFDGVHSAQKVVGEKRARIDAELPRLVETVAQELEGSRDVLSILEGYLPSAGELFGDELKITISEMKSGSQEQALNHLAGRVGSANLSQVVRGLLIVLRGGDGKMYFGLLAHDFQRHESQALEKEAIKRPGQMKKYSWLMLACFAAAYIYVIVVQVLSSTNGLWG